MNRRLDRLQKAGANAAATGTLRLLATTDLHGHLFAHDYIKDIAAPGTGLAGIATLVAEARAEAKRDRAACILVDNGDTLQGTPLAEHLAAHPVTADHAIAASLAELRYDAIGIGNHDFDYGLTYLREVAGHIGAPMVCSNVQGIPLDPICTHALVTCSLPDSDGTHEHQLRIGILSVIPTLTSVWNRHTLGQDARVEPSAACLERRVAQLRQEGAGLIVVLAHMGMGDHADIDTAQAGALALRDVTGVDVLITGHTHRRLPGADYAGRDGIDATLGRVGKIPAIMAGHAGSDLGVLDLALERGPEGAWTVMRHAGALRPNTAQTPPHPAILKRAQAAHDATRAQFSAQVATTDKPLYSYFALVAPAQTMRLLAEAKACCIRRALNGSAYADLPLLATAAAHAAGGRAGPDHYLHIPKGDMLRRHIAGLSPYANKVVAVLASGREIRDRLEYAARVFARIAPNRPDQPLIDARVPGFHFDTLYGLSYLIDPSAPIGARIRDLRWQGNPLTADQRFIIATNQFRAAGGGGYAPCTPDQIIARHPEPMSELLVRHLRDPETSPFQEGAPWRFSPLNGIQATFNSAPEAANYLHGIDHLSPQLCGQTREGFLRIRVTL